MNSFLRATSYQLRAWLPVILWAALIFLFSANPDPYRFLPAAWRSAVPIPAISNSSAAELLGQLMHFLEYAVLAFLLSRALFITRQYKISNDPNSFRIEKSFLKNLTASAGLRTHLPEQHLIQRTPRSLTRGSLIAVLLSMLYALSDETHQLFVPGRAFQVVDLVVDLGGILTGVWLWKKVLKRGT